MTVRLRLILIVISTFTLFSCQRTLAQTDSKYSVENSGIIRLVRTSPFLHTVSLTNKLTGKKMAVESEEFKLMIDDTAATFGGPTITARDFRQDGEPVLSHDRSTLSVPLRNDRYGIRVVVIYSADGKTTMHKWLDVSVDRPHNISTIEVERMAIEDVAPLRPSLANGENTQDDGPVFADNFFLGLEFPKQDNSFDGPFIRLRHFPGKDLRPGETLVSKKAVIGASPNTPLHRLKDSFLDYIDGYRNPKIRNFKVYNTWFLLVFAQKEDTLLQAIDTHVKPLLDRGIKLDGFVVDDGWQNKNTLWQVDSAMIPSGLGPDGKLQKRLKEYGTNLHLWLPLTGQYGIGETRKDSNWYTSRGYETGTNWCLCLAPGNKIFRDKKERLLELVRMGITSMKADFALLGCNKKGHHHLPNARYGMEANIEGVIDIIQSLRKENPSLFYYLTTAINKNPWWLGTNDVLWESFWDDIKYYSGNHEATPAQIRMSGRDEWHWQNNMRWFVPQTSYMTHGIIASNDPKDELYCSLQELIDIATLYYARGVMWSEIYVTGMDDKYWDALADVIKWSDAHWSILTKQPAMSGGPSGKRPYYWSHFSADTGLIIVRNPTATDRGIAIPLNESSRMPEMSGQTYRAEIVKTSPLSNVVVETLGYYHYGDTVTATIKPWQLKVIQITPVPPHAPMASVPAEIDFGLLDLDMRKDTVVTIRNAAGYTPRIQSGPFINLRPGKDGSTFQVMVNSRGMQYATTYTGSIALRSQGRLAPVREIIVRFQTIVDPNAPFLPLSELEPESHHQGYGQFGYDKSVDGNPLTIAGKKFQKGIGTHAAAETIFKIDDYHVKRFTAMVGQDDETKGTIEFSVFRDFGKGFEKTPAFASGVMRKGDPAKPVDIDLNGAVRLKLVVGNGGDGINGDHADWADAKLVR